MVKKTYKQRIIKASKEAGTYQPFFDEVIDTLAQLLETRDRALEQYVRSGSNPVVAHTNKAGATNIIKNPTLVMVLDLNAQALTYWRDLGLTPKGLKAINEEGLKKEKKVSFSDLLGELSG